jgi:hypothetical protein
VSLLPLQQRVVKNGFHHVSDEVAIKSFEKLLNSHFKHVAARHTGFWDGLSRGTHFRPLHSYAGG